MHNLRENRVNNVEETQSNTWKQLVKAGLILVGAVGVYFASKVSGIFSLTNLLRRTPDAIEDATAICAAETVQFDGGAIDCNIYDSWSRITSELTPGIESSIVPTKDEKCLVIQRAENEFGEKDNYAICVDNSGISSSVVPTKDEKYLVIQRAENEFGEKDNYAICVDNSGISSSKFRIKRHESGDVYFCFKETVGLKSTNDKAEESEQSVPSFDR